MGTVNDSERRENLLSNRKRAERWQAEFPYEWDADDLVSRRKLLRWAVMTSGALFGATGILAALGFARDQRTEGGQRIAEESEVPAGSALYFEHEEEEEDAILLHLEEGQFVAYSSICTHLECGVYYDPDLDELICPCHDGFFDPRTGEVLAGPPTRPLPEIALRSENGVLYTAGTEGES